MGCLKTLAIITLVIIIASFGPVGWIVLGVLALMFLFRKK